MTNKIQWYCCSKCGIVESYKVYSDGDTSFPRGEFLVHQDFIVAGMNTKQEAQEWLIWMQNGRQGETPSIRKQHAR